MTKNKVTHICLAIFHPRLMKPWGKLSKTVDKVETLLLSCFSRRKLIFKVGKKKLAWDAFLHFPREINLRNF